MVESKMKIMINAKGEPKGFEEFNSATVAHIVGANIIQGATEGGRTAVEFYLVDENGNRYKAAVTARIMLGLNSVIRGAMHRFNDNPDNP